MSVADTSSSSAPEANAYEFQSSGVVAMLEKLLEKFQDELFALRKEEMNAKANYELLAQKLTAMIGDAEDAIKEKTTAKAGRLEDAADAKGDLEKTEGVRMRRRSATRSGSARPSPPSSRRTRSRARRRSR